MPPISTYKAGMQEPLTKEMAGSPEAKREESR
jgi:hypothetical protein